MGILILLIVFVSALIALALDASAKNNRDESSNRNIDWLKSNQINTTNRIVYTYNGYEHSVTIDEQTRRLGVSSIEGSKIVLQKILDFDRIIGCEIQENGQRSSGIGRAVGGAILAGGVGAIVGGLTNKHEYVTIDVFIHINDLQSPFVKFHFYVDAPSGRDLSSHYSDVMQFANRISSSIQAIVMQQNYSGIKEITQNNLQIKGNTASAHNRLEHLKSLYASKLISEEEYQAKKAEILSQL